MDRRLDNRAAWASYLSNAALIDDFCATVADYEQNSGARRRMDILCEEIRQRELAGTLTDSDWRLPDSEAVRPDSTRSGRTAGQTDNP